MNYWLLAVFAAGLVAAGALGFLLPPGSSPMSAAPAYNAFHLFFGLLGLALVVAGRPGPIRAFNAGFGLLDLYQAAASRAGWFPGRYFRWRRADDVVHVVFGLLLVGAGLLAD